MTPSSEPPSVPTTTCHRTPTASCPPRHSDRKPCPLGHSLAAYPTDCPSFSSTHLGDFPVPLIPKQKLGRDGQKVTVPVPTSGRREKSATVLSRCQALRCVLYRTIPFSPEQGSESIIIPITQTGKLMLGKMWGLSNRQTIKEGQALTPSSTLSCISMF